MWRKSLTVDPAILAAAAAEYHEQRGDRSRIVVGLPAAPQVELVRADAIEPEPIRWLWPGWMAKGKLHIIGGSPGAGKTTICLRMSATVSTGGAWPDGSHAPIGNVVIWSGEDDPADTLVPRLIASGADMRRIFFVGGVYSGDIARAFDPSRDIGPLQAAIERAGGAALIIVDPIVNAVTGDSHKNTETRRGLQPLVDLAAATDAALIGVTHVAKGSAGREPLERLSGSLAFGAVARIVLMAAKKAEDDGPAPRIVCRVKSNIGPDGNGFTYEICQTGIVGHPGVETSYVEWGEAVKGSPRELLGEPDDDKGRAESDAETFLKALLADGPMAAKDVKEAAEANGLAWRTVRRAQKALGVKVARSGFGPEGQWTWSLQP